jgi:molecular chaperone DnaK (HSP70)
VFIGIDLGTSNCTLSYILEPKNNLDLELRINIFDIKQINERGATELSNLLPSVLFFNAQDTNYSVGIGAQKNSLLNPSYGISSSKSWLANTLVNRSDKILPWGFNDISDDKKLSPAECATELLNYIKLQWNEANPNHKLEEQKVVVTVPASFDEIACSLTRSALESAGFPKDTNLLEEPQAAFYDFLAQYNKQNIVENSQILVIDIGGGTCDFSLFAYSNQDSIERVKIGDHLLLGGDNIDLAIAHFIRTKYHISLSRYQWNYLIESSKNIKEQYLNDSSTADSFKVVIPTESSSLFEGFEECQITNSELTKIIFEDFFKPCQANEFPQISVGVKQIGLPYPSDPTFTKHLAKFLSGDSCDCVLFVGGTTKSNRIKNHLLSILQNWSPTSKKPICLNYSSNDFLELYSVSRGAAYYAFTKYKQKKLVKSSYLFSVYLKVAEKVTNESQYLCVLKKGSEPGTSNLIKTPLYALLGKDISLPLIKFQDRTTEEVGDLTNLVANTKEHLFLKGNLTCSLKERGKRIPVLLKVSHTELDSLEIQLVDTTSERNWILSYALRSEDKTQTSNTSKSSAHYNLGPAKRIIELFYGSGKDKPEYLPKNIIRNLEATFNSTKSEWPIEILRTLWSFLELGITKKSRSLDHESSFFQLAGFFLRPGFGYELDETRIESLWKLTSLGIHYKNKPLVFNNWIIMWRRVAGGLSRQQQKFLFDSFPSTLNDETILLGGSLERLSIPDKIKFGDELIKQILKSPQKATLAYHRVISRLLTRVPVYASSETIVPYEKVAEWFLATSKLDWSQSNYSILAKGFIDASRPINDPLVELPLELKNQIIDKISRYQSLRTHSTLINKPITRSKEEIQMLIGDSLPLGLELQ